jgi:ubiquinone/menaquinone biosynthesis C-methylase UbiE
MYNPEEFWKNELGGGEQWASHAENSPALQKSIDRVKTLIIKEIIKRKPGSYDQKFQGGVLDAGCGSGYAIKAFKDVELWDKYYGIDFQQHRIDYCYAKYGVKDIQFICSNLNTMPIPNKSISTIYTGAVLMHIPVENKIKVIDEFKRVLRDDGFYFGHEVVMTDKEIYDAGGHVINTNLEWLQKQFDPFQVEVVTLHYDTYDFQMIYAHK